MGVSWINCAGPDPEQILYREGGYGYDLEGSESLRGDFAYLVDRSYDQCDAV